jgi:hypothetical protein
MMFRSIVGALRRCDRLSSLDAVLQSNELSDTLFIPALQRYTLIAAKQRELRAKKPKERNKSEKDDALVAVKIMRRLNHHASIYMSRSKFVSADDVASVLRANAELCRLVEKVKSNLTRREQSNEHVEALLGTVRRGVACKDDYNAVQIATVLDCVATLAQEQLLEFNEFAPLLESVVERACDQDVSQSFDVDSLIDACEALVRLRVRPATFVDQVAAHRLPLAELPAATARRIVSALCYLNVPLPLDGVWGRVEDKFASDADAAHVIRLSGCADMAFNLAVAGERAISALPTLCETLLARFATSRHVEQLNTLSGMRLHIATSAIAAAASRKAIADRARFLEQRSGQAFAGAFDLAHRRGTKLGDAIELAATNVGIGFQRDQPVCRDASPLHVDFVLDDGRVALAGHRRHYLHALHEHHFTPNGHFALHIESIKRHSPRLVIVPFTDRPSDIEQRLKDEQ